MPNEDKKIMLLKNYAQKALLWAKDNFPKEQIINLFSDKKNRIILELSLLGFIAAISAVLHFKANAIKPTEQPAMATQHFEGNFSGTLDAMLMQAGIDGRHRAALANAVARKINLRRLKPTDRYEILTGTDSKPELFLIETSAERFLFERKGNDYDGQAISLNAEKRIRTLSGTIKESLWSSMSEAGMSAPLIIRFAEIMQWTVDFVSDTRNGDFWAAEIEEEIADNGRVINRSINALRYDGKAAGRNSAALHKGNYYDEKGNMLKSMFLRAPLVYTRISSHFSLSRFHPIKKISRPHLATDYAAPAGTPVSAVADGNVRDFGKKGEAGNMVILKHPLGYETYYLHLSKFAKGMSKGKKYRQGDIIGYVGSTGIATGPHLDFRIKQNGKNINFEKMKRVSPGKLNAAEIEAVKQKIAELPKSEE